MIPPNIIAVFSSFLRSASYLPPMILRYKIVSSPTLHRLCTDFGTEEERRIIGGRTRDHPLQRIPCNSHLCREKWDLQGNKIVKSEK